MKPTPELRKMVRRWQRELGLMHWTVRIAVSADDTSPTGDAANVERQPELRNAVIVFFQSAFDHELEETVIHELLHMHMAHFRNEPGTAAGDCEEHAVYAISKCIVRLAHGIVQ